VLVKCWHSLLSCSRSVLKINEYSRIVDLVVVCSVFFFFFLFVVTLGSGCRQVWLILCFVVLELVGVLGTLYLETPLDNNTFILAAGVRTSGGGRWNGRSSHV
jgi:uncharacterized membrane protein YdbT with pleckstrin-like domain